MVGPIGGKQPGQRVFVHMPVFLTQCRSNQLTDRSIGGLTGGVKLDAFGPEPRSQGGALGGGVNDSDAWVPGFFKSINL